MGIVSSSDAATYSTPTAKGSPVPKNMVARQLLYEFNNRRRERRLVHLQQLSRIQRVIAGEARKRGSAATALKETQA